MKNEAIVVVIVLLTTNYVLFVVYGIKKLLGIEINIKEFLDEIAKPVLIFVLVTVLFVLFSYEILKEFVL